jgi:hypothetical protein
MSYLYKDLQKEIDDENKKIIKLYFDAFSIEELKFVINVLEELIEDKKDNEVDAYA